MYYVAVFFTLIGVNPTLAFCDSVQQHKLIVLINFSSALILTTNCLDFYFGCTVLLIPSHTLATA